MSRLQRQLPSLPVDRSRPMPARRPARHRSLLSRVLWQIAVSPSPSAAVSESRPQLRRRPTLPERRRFPRHRSPCVIRVVRHLEQIPPARQLEWTIHATRVKGHVLDVSMNGIAFTVPTELCESETIWLRIENRRQDIALDRPARVLRVIPAGEGLWKVTCRFQRPLAMNEVQTIGNLM